MDLKSVSRPHLKALDRQIKAERKLVSYVIYTVGVLLTVFLLVKLFFGGMGLFRYLELKDRRDALAAEVEEINRLNAVLDASLREFKGNDFYLEKYAREDYGLKKPDEFVFIYEKAK